MKRITILFGAGILLFSSIVLAAVPQFINFQGVLKDANGQPAADGSYPVKFEIFNSVGPGGGCLWEENQQVITQGGLFSVLLGSTVPIPDSAFNDSTRWLAVTVGNDPEISPRQRLASVGYAYRVNSVDGAMGGNIYGDVTFHGNIIGSIQWTAFPFNGNNYNDYVVAHGGDWQTVQYRKIGDIVYLRGKIHKVDHSMFQEGETFGILPPGFRPPARLTFSPLMGPYKNVLEITSGGLVIFKQHDSSSETFSLDDIFFSTSP